MSSRLLRLASSRLLFGTLAGLLLGAGGALAQDRCEGTLCDFYYDHMAAPPQKQRDTSAQAKTQAAPAQKSDGLLGRLFGGTPQPQTSEAPPAKRPMVAVQGGGLIGLMQGTTPSRCTGTLCDLYYGGPPPEEPAQPVPTAMPADDETAAEEAPTRGRRARTVTPSDDQPSCVANARDPWRCYR